MSRFHTSAFTLLAAATISIAAFSSAASAQGAPDWQVSTASSAAASLAGGDRDWSPHGPWLPLVSTGVGAADAAPAGSDGPTGFAYQALVSAAHPLDGRLTGEVKYRHAGVDDARFGAVAQRFNGDDQPSTVTIGFRYSFGQ